MGALGAKQENTEYTIEEQVDTDKPLIEITRLETKKDSYKSD